MFISHKRPLADITLASQLIPIGVSKNIIATKVQNLRMIKVHSNYYTDHHHFPINRLHVYEKYKSKDGHE